MGKLEHFEILTGHAVFRPRGRISIEDAADLVTRAIAFAREQRIRNLLIDVSDLIGIEPPSLASRYFLIRAWAREARGSVRVAFVAKPELIDHKKFGRTVAANAGFIADVFTTHEDALLWLQIIKEKPPEISEGLSQIH